MKILKTQKRNKENKCKSQSPILFLELIVVKNLADNCREWIVV